MGLGLFVRSSRLTSNGCLRERIQISITQKGRATAASAQPALCPSPYLHSAVMSGGSSKPGLKYGSATTRLYSLGAKDASVASRFLPPNSGPW